MSVNEIRHFIFEYYYKRIGLLKESSFYSMKRLKKKKKRDLVLPATKLIEKVAHPSNAKEYYNSCLKKKYKIGKTMKSSKINEK